MRCTCLTGFAHGWVVHVQAAGPEEDGAETVDARTKRLAADRLLHSSRGSRSRHAAFELYAWAAEHGSAPAMLSLAR